MDWFFSGSYISLKQLTQLLLLLLFSNDNNNNNNYSYNKQANNINLWTSVYRCTRNIYGIGIRNMFMLKNPNCSPKGIDIRAGFRTGQAEQLPRGLHKPGRLHICLVTFMFWYSRVGVASTAPLPKAAQGPPPVWIRPWSISDPRRMRWARNELHHLRNITAESLLSRGWVNLTRC